MTYAPSARGPRPAAMRKVSSTSRCGAGSPRSAGSSGRLLASSWICTRDPHFSQLLGEVAGVAVGRRTHTRSRTGA